MIRKKLRKYCLYILLLLLRFVVVFTLKQMKSIKFCLPWLKERFIHQKEGTNTEKLAVIKFLRAKAQFSVDEAYNLLFCNNNSVSNLSFIIT